MLEGDNAVQSSRKNHDRHHCYSGFGDYHKFDQYFHQMGVAMTEASTWGDCRPDAGRKKGSAIKPVSERRTATVVVQCTADQKEKIKAKAERAGLSVSTYLLRLALGE